MWTIYIIRNLYTSIRSLHQDNGWFCAFADIILEICGLLTTCSAWHNHGWNPPFRAFPKSNLKGTRGLSRWWSRIPTPPVILPGARSLEGVLPKKMPSNSQLSTSWQLATLQQPHPTSSWRLSSSSSWSWCVSSWSRASPSLDSSKASDFWMFEEPKNLKEYNKETDDQWASDVANTKRWNRSEGSSYH